jgi:hypothetical protein
MILTGKPEVLGDKPASVPLVHHKRHMDWPGTETGTPRRDAGE